MYELPTSIEVNGESLGIRDNGDFRVVLHCFNVLNAEDLIGKEKILACLILFYDCFDDIEDVMHYPHAKEAAEKMYDFMSCSQRGQKASEARLIDWDKDEMLITSAINNVAGKEIRAESYLHWWTFIGYYMAIGECALSQIVAIRYKIAHSEKLEKYEKKFRNENPQYFNIDMRSASQKEADDYVANMWNDGGET